MAYVEKPEDIVFPFGKHKGKTLGDILVLEPTYLDWAVDVVTSPLLKRAVRTMCDKYAVEIAKAREAYTGDTDAQSLLPERVKEYIFTNLEGRFILVKEHGQKFHMKGEEQEAFEHALFISEQDSAKLKVVGLGDLHSKYPQ